MRPDPGPHAAHVCAFARQWRTESAVVVVPRLVAKLTGLGSRLPLGREVWKDTHIVLLPGLAGPRVNVYTGETAAPTGRGDGVAEADVLDRFPVALLEGPPLRSG